MRILLITGEFPPMQGGVGDYAREIARGLAAYVPVRVLTSRAAHNPEHPSRPEPFQVSSLIDAWNWSIFSTIKAHRRAFAADIVHIQYQTAAYHMHPAINFLPRSFKLSSRAPEVAAQRPRLVTTFHDLRIPYLFPKAGPVREWVTRQLASSSDAAVATNVPDYEQLGAWHVKDVSLIPIGSNLTATLPPDYDRARWRRELGVANEELLVCHFGFINERKGCDTLVRALAEIPRARLLMIGGQVGASDRTNIAALARLKTLIGELDLAERVLWTGFAPPQIVSAHFRAADLCALPYREGASFQHGTLMAALAHAMPLVTTHPAVSGMALPSSLPSLTDGENGLLVPPDDPQALARAIRRMADSPELRERLSQGACELAQHFTWDKIVRQHLALYERLL